MTGLVLIALTVYAAFLILTVIVHWQAGRR